MHWFTMMSVSTCAFLDSESLKKGENVSAHLVIEKHEQEAPGSIYPAEVKPY